MTSSIVMAMAVLAYILESDCCPYDKSRSVGPDIIGGIDHYHMIDSTPGFLEGLYTFGIYQVSSDDRNLSYSYIISCISQQPPIQ